MVGTTGFVSTSVIHNILCQCKPKGPLTWWGFSLLLRPSEQEIRAKKREIAIRYARSGYKPTIDELRTAELTRLLEYRRSIGYFNLQPVMNLLEHPRRLKAITVGRIILLTYSERQLLNIKTMAPYDISISEVRNRQREAKRLADRVRAEKKRRASGALMRAEYEENSLSRTRPWELVGMSKRTWYRRGRPLPLAQVRR